MNSVHLHLLTNHVSVFALVFALAVLLVSMKRRSVDLRMTATVLFVMAAVFAWVAQLTGEGADAMADALGIGPDSFIEEHELAAVWAVRSATVVAIFALAMEWSVRKMPSWTKPLKWALVFFALHGCTVFARTAFLGGLIRHTEIRD